MIYSQKTNSSILSVKEEITAKAKEQGFGILKEYSFKSLLKEKGFPIERDITVYELCDPASAQAALSMHPEFSVYLPCRLSLYEDNGKTVLSTIGIEDILSAVEADASFKAFMHVIFGRLKALINNWA
ncbi:DUF302 domain-containing protein [Sulfurovum sp. CS9]|uniref:DUF302 domain-containing protein n=1 Tax=Sulfurovum sp. CS9 TaxID=3391146 RepID=UPI0039EAA2B5